MINSFKLGARAFRVETSEALHTEVIGAAVTDLNKIILYTKLGGGTPVPKTTLDQTLVHEVVHCILEALGRDDLSQDENFVQSFSLLLHQYQETAK